jgi:hypothetical protein
VLSKILWSLIDLKVTLPVSAMVALSEKQGSKLASSPPQPLSTCTGAWGEIGGRR